jgi:hypothetical protein
MRVKLTTRNRLTLSKEVLSAVGGKDYFEVEVIRGQIVLTPVRIQRGNAVRAKLAALGPTDADVVAAREWARRNPT